MCGVLGSRFQCTYAAMTRGKGEKSKDTRLIEIYRIRWEREIEGADLGKGGVGYHDGGGEEGLGWEKKVSSATAPRRRRRKDLNLKRTNTTPPASSGSRS